ncbi:MAG: hypothetical protein ACR2K9_06125 [Solirubrobacteraceae bacterium]
MRRFLLLALLAATTLPSSGCGGGSSRAAGELRSATDRLRAHSYLVHYDRRTTVNTASLSAKRRADLFPSYVEEIARHENPRRAEFTEIAPRKSSALFYDGDLYTGSAGGPTRRASPAVAERARAYYLAHPPLSPRCHVSRVADFMAPGNRRQARYRVRAEGDCLQRQLSGVLAPLSKAKARVSFRNATFDFFVDEKSHVLAAAAARVSGTTLLPGASAVIPFETVLSEEFAPQAIQLTRPRV